MWLRPQAGFLVVGPESRPWDPSLKGGLGLRGGSSPPLGSETRVLHWLAKCQWGGGWGGRAVFTGHAYRERPSPHAPWAVSLLLQCFGGSRCPVPKPLPSGGWHSPEHPSSLPERGPIDIWWDSDRKSVPSHARMPRASTFCPHFTPSVAGKDLSSFSVCMPVVSGLPRWLSW